jgi:hypothetical protein
VLCGQSQSNRQSDHKLKLLKLSQKKNLPSLRWLFQVFYPSNRKLATFKALISKILQYYEFYPKYLDIEDPCVNKCFPASPVAEWENHALPNKLVHKILRGKLAHIHFSRSFRQWAQEEWLSVGFLVLPLLCRSVLQKFLDKWRIWWDFRTRSRGKKGSTGGISSGLQQRREDK